MPDSRRLAWLLMCSPEALTPDESAQLDRLRHVERLSLSYDLPQRFLIMIRTRAEAQLEDWLQASVRTGMREWQALASGMRQDLAAIRAALTSPWSNGQTEGQVNRLKLFRRQMNGRAKLDLRGAHEPITRCSQPRPGKGAMYDPDLQGRIAPLIAQFC